MRIDYGLAGHNHKAFVKALEKVVGKKSIYEGAPKYGFQLGNWYVDKDGFLIIPRKVSDKEKDRVNQELKECGFEPVDLKKNEMPDSFCISMPLEGFTDQAILNLEKLIASKASLIRKALACDSLNFEVSENKISFPWFIFPNDPEVTEANAIFISLLCNAAKTQRRVTAKERAVENEKYAMRCFLLRLGMIGDEYKQTRKSLLSRLSGNAAFRDLEAQNEG